MKDLDVFQNFLRDLQYLDSFENFKWIHQPLPEVPSVKRRCRKRFNPLNNLDEQQFRFKYRFTKENMRRIIELIRDDLEVERELSQATYNKQVPVELQIMAAIRFWGQTEHSEVTANIHSVSNRTLAKICRRVAAALASKASRYIRMPATLAEKERVTNAFQALAGMPQVIGAIGYSNVQLQPSMFLKEIGNDLNANVGNIHIQVVSDASYKIRDLDCKLRSFESENYYSEMFTQTRIKERFEQNEFRGRILLGDDRLCCTPYLFTPIPYPDAPEEYAFNRVHGVTFACVTNCLSLWRRRFGILGTEISASYCTAKHTIVALALLHNMAIEWNDQSFGCNLDEYSTGCYFMNSFPLGKPATSTRSTDIDARIEFIKHNF